ncbi:MAG: phenylalanine--tRNA ligase subunit alpha [Pantoea sp. Brub]|nr:phenylalanine--tRNA ligase subunit alpha [Pantoea sp. Brub]
MFEIENLLNKAISAIEQSISIAEIEKVRIKYIGKKGYITQKFNSLSNLPIELRPKAGFILNKAKNKIIKHIQSCKNKLNSISLDADLLDKSIDISLPGRYIENGSLHPITHTINRIKDFFNKLSFEVIYGLEIEDSYHNFDALNIPKYHPSRTSQDTFWFNDNILLRTQTSSVQIREMKHKKPPIRIISPGKVYRNDYDREHTPMFHQVEGLMIDKNINFSNLKSIMYDFLNYFFGKDIKIRFRPSYFPFTEPSAEFDIMNDDNNHWIEVLGCGLVHPSILLQMKIDTNIYSGFAFGLGVERLAMLLYGISDIRLFFENDIRFLQQFKKI